MTAERYEMTVSRNGQVSIPAAVRARWRAEKVDVIDMGDRLIIAPVVADPIGAARGSIKPAVGARTAEDLRAQARLENDARDLRVYGRV